MQWKGSEKLGLFKSKEKIKFTSNSVTVQTGNSSKHPFGEINSYTPLSKLNNHIYSSLREAVPIIDTAVYKICRLIGGFRVETGDAGCDMLLENFLHNVNVSGNQIGIESYISTYLEQLLTYGTAVGEIVLSENKIAALFNSDLESVEVKRGKSPIELDFYARNGFELLPIKYPQLINFSVLNPEPGEILGNSLLRGLPFVSDILLKIYNTIGTNWERLGNLRFAVTYKPQNDSADKAFAKERAMQMASQWSEAMQSKGAVKDFVAVGDVSIKVIGADNQILDSEVPVRQMLEQIVAKTGLPPFILGLSWSTSERMSKQQADVLTTELEYYRRILTPVIFKIADLWLKINGFAHTPKIIWDDITLQDEVEIGRAKLYNAQAEKISREVSI